MYKKLIISENKRKPNHHDLLWLSSKRVNATFGENEIKINNEIINFNEVSELLIYSYNSFLFFNVYSIFCFKFNMNYYQIGINNSEKNKLEKYFGTIEKYKVKSSLMDIIYFIIIILSFSTVIYFLVKG